MTTSSERDQDPNLDEYAYEHPADEHADNPHPDADGDVTVDPAAPDDPTGVIDPKAD